jgi:putative phage-type endonuclease
MSYKLINLKTEKEWHNWRDQKIGASDAPIIAGLSPYKKRADLLEEKRTGKKKPVNDYILNKGHKYEAKMRPIAEMLLGLNLKPAFMESTEFSFMSASLDGFDPEKNIGWECKLCGQDMFEYCVSNKKPPKKYIRQVQQQILIGDLEKVIFWCGTDETNYTYFDVYRDQKIIDDLIKENKEFWDEWHQKVEAPEELNRLLVNVWEIKKLISRLKKDEKKLMDKIKSIDFKDNYSFRNISYKRSVSYSDSLNMEKVKKDFDLSSYYERRENIKYLIKGE